MFPRIFGTTLNFETIADSSRRVFGVSVDFAQQNSVRVVKCSLDGSVAMHLLPKNTMTRSRKAGLKNQLVNNTRSSYK